MKVILSNRAYSTIISETSKRFATETGGIFLGCYIDMIWFIIETIKPGPNAIFTENYFEYDHEYATFQINKKAKEYIVDLSLVGVWHKHPGLYNSFTATDDETNSLFAKLSDNGAISILVNVDSSIILTPYHVSWPLKYTKLEHIIGDKHIPSSLLAQKK